MPQVRPLPSLAAKYYPAQYALISVCLVAFTIVFVRASLRDGIFYGALVTFVLSAAGTFLTDRLMIRRVPCPTCGTPLGRLKAPKGKLMSVQYECGKCDTIWDADYQGEEPVKYSDRL